MKIILIAFLISSIIAIIISLILLNLKKEVKEIIPVIVTIIGSITLFSTLYSITNCIEYKDWRIASETEIARLSDTGGKTIYAKYKDGKYIYRYKTNEVDLWTETARGYITCMEEATVIEDINCDVPEIIKYEKEPIKWKFLNWTLATFCSSEVKYVLYVPEGSIEY